MDTMRRRIADAEKRAKSNAAVAAHGAPSPSFPVADVTCCDGLFEKRAKIRRAGAERLPAVGQI